MSARSKPQRATITANGGSPATNGSARMPTPMSLCCWRAPKARRRAPAGLALFALPRRLKDGSRNTYRIVRLKDKLGTRSMASGEIRLEGAVAYLVGDADRGLKQMMEQVNLSRLSHGVRAAAMMRRCVNEAMVCARSRAAFGKTIIEYPLLRRQLLKITVPTEQSLSMFLFAASAMDRANAGSKEAESVLAHSHPAAEIPRLPRQHSGGDGSDGSARRQRLHRGMGACAADPRRPCRRALGRHQQHQRARYHYPRGRQKPRPPHAGRRADEIARPCHTHPGAVPGSPAPGAGADAGLRRARRGRTCAGSRPRGRPPARSITSPAPS